MTTTRRAGGGARSKHDLPPVPIATLASLLGFTDAVDNADAVDNSAETAAAAAAALADIVHAGLGRHPAAQATIVTPVPHAMGSPATGGIYRISGRDTGGEPWAVFCKVLQHVRHWPMLSQLPQPIATHFADTFPWRSELELWDPRVQASFPPGLRSPTLLRLVELPDDRVAVWQEDIAEGIAPWDDAAYARAAHLLGRWNARSTTPEVLSVSGFPAGYALRMYAEQSVAARGLPALANQQLWTHPWLAGHRPLADRLLELAVAIPKMLDRLDEFIQALPHGDASPQNLLMPADGTALVAIDVSFRSPHALGFDLGQLLVGLVHADVIPARRMPGIAAAIVPAYLEGLEVEGLRVPAAHVEEAFVTSVLLRSAFDGLLLGELDSARATDPPSAAFSQRIEMASQLVDLYTRTTSSLGR